MIEDDVISSYEVRDAIAREPDKKGFFCGVPQLDEIIEGFETGELVVIAGRTGMGKTLLAQTITDQLFKGQINSLWFSYEMTNRQFLSRFDNLPLFYMPRILKERALEWIEKKIIEAKENFNCQAVFIDHLHFLIDMAVSQNASLRIGQIVRSLKTLALKHDIVIFLLCHTTKSQDKVPSIEILRDSSLIGAEADLVLMVWRIEDDLKKGEMNLSGVIVEKARRTGAWKKKIKLIKRNGLLEQA